jgi:hypothetical protein
MKKQDQNARDGHGYDTYVTKRSAHLCFMKSSTGWKQEMPRHHARTGNMHEANGFAFYRFTVASS